MLGCSRFDCGSSWATLSWITLITARIISQAKNKSQDVAHNTQQNLASSSLLEPGTTVPGFSSEVVKTIARENDSLKNPQEVAWVRPTAAEQRREWRLLS